MLHDLRMSDRERKYATVQHPTMEALVHGLYRYKDRAQAQARLKQIRDHFVLSKEQPESTAADPALILWIKGFSLTEEDIAKGFTGHFAHVTITERAGKGFTLLATKLDRPITTHPQKKRLQSKHPNWGHPVMRAVKKQKIYATIEAAQAELGLLHEEYPEVSIPGQGRLFIIIYEKRPGIPRPTHKIALELQAHRDGGFVISWRDNERQKPIPLQQPDAAPKGTEEPKTQTPGYFASAEAVRKTRKRKAPPRVGSLNPPVAEESEAAPIPTAPRFTTVEKERAKRRRKRPLLARKKPESD